MFGDPARMFSRAPRCGSQRAWAYHIKFPLIMQTERFSLTSTRLAINGRRRSIFQTRHFRAKSINSRFPVLLPSCLTSPLVLIKN